MGDDYDYYEGEGEDYLHDALEWIEDPNLAQQEGVQEGQPQDPSNGMLPAFQMDPPLAEMDVDLDEEALLDDDGQVLGGHVGNDIDPNSAANRALLSETVEPAAVDGQGPPAVEDPGHARRQDVLNPQAEPSMPSIPADYVIPRRIIGGLGSRPARNSRGGRADYALHHTRARTIRSGAGARLASRAPGRSRGPRGRGESNAGNIAEFQGPNRANLFRCCPHCFGTGRLNPWHFARYVNFCFTRRLGRYNGGRGRRGRGGRRGSRRPSY